MIFLRKIRSVILRVSVFIRMKFYINYLNYFYDGISVAPSVLIGHGVKISSTDGGSILIQGKTSIDDFSKIIARSGKILIGENVFIGNGCILVGLSSIVIGSDTLIGEYVVIRDQDHIVASKPIRKSGFLSNSIKIGANCWLGSKVTILRGSSIGDGAVIGAHSLVRGDIPPYTLAVGCPAKVVKHLPRP